MKVPCDEDQTFERLLILGDTNFYCTVHLNDTVKATSESDINGIIHGFIKQFFTCKILNEYKVALSDQWVSVTILLRRNFRESPKHCPWDYLLFASKSDDEVPAPEQANGAKFSNQLQICPDNTLQELESVDHHASLTSKHGPATSPSQVSSKPVQACCINLAKEANSQQIVSADDPGQICSDKIALGNCSAIIAKENSASSSLQIVETDREVGKDSSGKVLCKASHLIPDEENEANSMINIPTKAVHKNPINTEIKDLTSTIVTERNFTRKLHLTKLSSLLSKTNGEAPFDPDFETMRDTCAWLCNNEIHLVMTDSEASLECVSGTEEETQGRVEEERNDSVNDDHNFSEDSKSVAEPRDRGRMYRAAKSLYNRRSRRLLMQTRIV